MRNVLRLSAVLLLCFAAAGTSAAADPKPPAKPGPREPEGLWQAAAFTDMMSAPPAEARTDSGLALSADGTPSTPRPARRREQRTPWFAILVFSPLVL